MAKLATTKIQELLDTAHDYFDSIVDYYPTTEFLEVTGLRGGESHTYRFYYNGLVTER